MRKADAPVYFPVIHDLTSLFTNEYLDFCCHCSFNVCNLLIKANLPTSASVQKALLVSCWVASLVIHSWFLDMKTAEKFLLWFILILLLAWSAGRIVKLKQASNTEMMKFDIGSVENRPTEKFTI